MSKNSKTTSEEYARFVETARALGCNEDEAAFDEKLKKFMRPRTEPPDGGPPADAKEPEK